MNKSKRQKEAEILKKMFEEDDSSANAKNADENPPSAEEKRKDGILRGSGENDVIRCPRCGCILPERAPCGKCGYNGYIPMTKAETRKIKLILYPIVLIIAIVFILWKNGVFG